MKATEAMKKQVTELSINIMRERKQGNINREQFYYDKLRAWCEKRNCDFDNAFNFGMSQAKKSAAAIMQGWV